MGVKNGIKMCISASLGSMLFQTLILVEFYYIFYEINDEKRVDFLVFLILFFVLFLMLETLKTSVLPR